jgi:hypothetical protein
MNARRCTPASLLRRATFVLLVAAVVIAPRIAEAANCSTIDDPDKRAYCRATASNSAGDCTFISDYNMRQTCRAEVSGHESNCNTVTSQWERERCRREAAAKKK